MHDPTVAIGALIGGIYAFLSGMMGGADPYALGIGFASAMFFAMWNSQIDNIVKSAGAILLSSWFAGFASPFVAHLLVKKWPNLAMRDDHQIIIDVCALIFGSLTPFFLTMLMYFTKRWLKIKSDF